jgi:hypothetical protein
LCDSLRVHFPLFFGDILIYTRRHGAPETFDLSAYFFFTCSDLVLKSCILLLHALYEIGIEKLQEALHIFKLAIQFGDS